MYAFICHVCGCPEKPEVGDGSPMSCPKWMLKTKLGFPWESSKLSYPQIHPSRPRLSLISLENNFMRSVRTRTSHCQTFVAQTCFGKGFQDRCLNLLAELCLRQGTHEPFAGTDAVPPGCVYWKDTSKCIVLVWPQHYGILLEKKESCKKWFLHICSSVKHPRNCLWVSNQTNGVTQRVQISFHINSEDIW